MNKTYKIVSVVGLVIGLVALVLVLTHKTASPSQSQSLGGTYSINNVASGATNGIDFGSPAINFNIASGKIGAKSNTAFWRNTTGMTQYVDVTEVSTDGTASSSYKIWAYASTTPPRALYDFVAPKNSTNTIIAINGFAFATSSTATTTNSDDRPSNGASGGSFAGNTIQVANNSYLDIVLQSTNDLSVPGVCSSAASGNPVCESATSTNRGFNVPWRLFYHN